MAGCLAALSRLITKHIIQIARSARRRRRWLVVAWLVRHGFRLSSAVRRRSTGRGMTVRRPSIIIVVTTGNMPSSASSK